MIGIVKTIASSFGNITSGITDVISKFVKDPNQAAILSSELTKLTIKAEADIAAGVEESYQQELKSKTEIMVAELKQDDKFTKRVRPTLLYAGLAMIVLDFLLRWACVFIGKEVLAFTIPSFFQEIWAGLCMVYIVSRSSEKKGTGNKLTKLITG
jgi:hypothetical protein